MACPSALLLEPYAARLRPPGPAWGLSAVPSWRAPRLLLAAHEAPSRGLTHGGEQASLACPRHLQPALIADRRRYDAAPESVGRTDRWAGSGGQRNTCCRCL